LPCREQLQANGHGVRFVRGTSNHFSIKGFSITIYHVPEILKSTQASLGRGYRLYRSISSSRGCISLQYFLEFLAECGYAHLTRSSGIGLDPDADIGKRSNAR
jgi:hypothetical protein